MNNINNTVAHKKENKRHTFGNIENHKMQFSDLSHLQYKSSFNILALYFGNL